MGHCFWRLPAAVAAVTAMLPSHAAWCQLLAAAHHAPCAAPLELPQKMLQHAPLAVDKPKFTDPHTKVNALVQVSGWWVGGSVWCVV